MKQKLKVVSILIALAHIVRGSLEEHEFKVVLCADSEQAYRRYVKQRPDILVLDVMMPKVDGFEFESELLNLLCQHPDDIIPRKLLLQKLWGDDSFFKAGSLDVFITKLREHLEVDPHVQLINIRGVGYKLVW